MIHAGFPELPRMDLVFLVPVGYITLYGDHSRRDPGTWLVAGRPCRAVDSGEQIS